MYGNVLLMAVLVNGRKSKALDIDWDPKTHQLNFSPPDVELYLGRKSSKSASQRAVSGASVVSCDVCMGFILCG